MSDQYYIRIRGRVQGPFDGDKLRQLARRGQFSRMHEISPDGQEWQSANERPELFAGPTVAQSAATAQAAGSPRQDGQAVSSPYALETQRGFPHQQAAAGGGKGASEGWYYVAGDKEQGPVDFASLYEMLASRRLVPETEVWRHGMAEWVPAHTIPGLVANATSQTRASPSSSEHAADELAPAVVRVLVESRGWVVFIAVMAFIYSAIVLTAGLLTLILRPRFIGGAEIASALIEMLFAVVVGAGGWLLMSYAAGVARVDRRRSEESLRVALGKLKVLWAYVGIVLIVLLTVAILAVIGLLSAAGSLSDLRDRL